jgi:hypothetical protein
MQSFTIMKEIGSEQIHHASMGQKRVFESTSCLKSLGSASHELAES